MSVISDHNIDITKALEMIERKKLANRKYYMKKHNIDGEALILNQEKLMIDRANKQILTYQKQLLRQRQQRVDAGPKRQGRPFTSQENEEKRNQLISQLENMV